MRFLSFLLLAGTCLAEPAARRVVQRGRTDLSRALRAALPPGAEHVAVVVDVTPYTAAHERVLFRALRELGGAGASWRIAALGRPLSKPVRAPSALVVHFPEVFARPTPVPNTFDALRRTLRGHRDGAVLYLADWHFEDDSDLEGFIAMLRRRRLALGVVGSEACFGAAWTDGFFRTRDAAHIGHHPFETDDPERPWHGGDLAFPHLPQHYALGWSTRFPSDRRRERRRGRRRYAETRKGLEAPPGVDEDLAARIAAIRPDAHERYAFPLPSGFGPYGLMRACGVTGGRYVLWSWNPLGRSDVTYDYSRCDLFGPDLRARAAIRRDVRRDPAARALFRAWNLVATDYAVVASVTAPLDADGRGVAMEETRARGGLGFVWEAPREHRRFLRDAPKTLKALDRAIGILGAARPAPADANGRRSHADAELFRHILEVLRFELGEAIVESLRIPADAWKDDDRFPGLRPETWIVRGGLDREPVELHDPARGARVYAERKRMLDAYRATPFGEMVRRNGVATRRLHWHRRGSGRPARETPAESSATPPPTTPPGGSTGAGPGTGR